MSCQLLRQPAQKVELVDAASEELPKRRRAVVVEGQRH